MGRWISRDPIAERGALNIYGYVGNSPIVYFDPLGLWQFTGSIDLGVGVYLSFGKNSGQWNMCVKGGLGAGLSGSIDFMDSGQKKSGFCPITVAGTVGAGILGAGGEAGMNPNGLYGSASGRAGPATVGGGVSIASPNAPPTYSKTAGYTNLGASLFVGTGWQL